MGLFYFFNTASISWVADSPLWRMFSRFVFALVGPESSSSNTVASTADHRDHGFIQEENKISQSKQ